MIIKKLVVGSLFSMLLVSEMAAADWGDVYYCRMTNNNGITLEGEMTKYKLEKFIFKLDQTKNAMVFGSSGHFANSVDELTTGRSFPIQEKWYANDKHSMTYFSKGRFLFTSMSLFDIESISADCEKF